MALARPAAAGQFVFIVIAFAALEYAFLNDDFSVLFVAQHSNSALPAFYKFTAAWGGHEGSMLFWITVLAIWTLAVAAGSRSQPEEFASRVLGVLGIVSAGIIAFALVHVESVHSSRADAGRRQRLEPAAARSRDDHPSADAVRRLRRHGRAVRVRRRGAAHGTARQELGEVDSAVDGRGVDIPDRAASRSAAGGRTTSSAGAGGGSGIPSRTLRSCRGSSRPRCCIRWP